MTKLTALLATGCGKTINLAKSKNFTIPRKPPLNSLKFEQLPTEPKSCSPLVNTASQNASKVKQIKMCPEYVPDYTYCSPKAIPCVTASQRIWKLVNTALKMLLVSGIVYYTWIEGLWSDAGRSTCFLGKIVDKFYNRSGEGDENAVDEVEAECMFDKPLIVVYNDCKPYVPQTEILSYNVKNRWNKTVIMFFDLLVHGPARLLAKLRTKDTID